MYTTSLLDVVMSPHRNLSPVRLMDTKMELLGMPRQSHSSYQHADKRINDFSVFEFPDGLHLCGWWTEYHTEQRAQTNEPSTG
jgi:hypothetical protein